MFRRLFLIVHILLALRVSAQPGWSSVQAHEWYALQGWIVGCNYIPGYAVNQIEMWQPETFDTVAINRELQWAQQIGFNTVRVFLHYAVWADDPDGFRERMDIFLNLCSHHFIRAIPVLFDDCWNSHAYTGPQPPPVPGVHNSRWVQCPGDSLSGDVTAISDFEKYTRDIIRQFRYDSRILMWDLYNEPGNSNYFSYSLLLLQWSFIWAREINPIHPLTCGVWNFDARYDSLNSFSIENSDIITFHHYGDTAGLKEVIGKLQPFNRPLICTEYLARNRNSRFETHLPVFKRYAIGAINWGLVSGKSQTIYPWESKEDSPEPDVWFHDIFRSDGTPFSPDEASFIRQITR